MLALQLNFKDMKRCILFLVLSCLLLSCKQLQENTPEIEIVSTHTGIVVNSNNQEPYADLDVVVTDGKNIHAKTITLRDGSFYIQVKSAKISDQYHLLIGNSHSENKEVALNGFGNQTYDHGKIYIKGPTVPILTTKSAFDITANSATLGGEIVENGGFDISQCGVCYSTSRNPTIQDKHTIDVNTNNIFNSSLSDLRNNTLYYARAYALNEIGIGYGNEITFVTIEGLPIVHTTEITEVNANFLKCGGDVIDEGGAVVTARGVCWSSTNKYPSTNDYKTINGGGLGTFQSEVSPIDVTQNTYYIRAYATNMYGTSYGDVIIQQQNKNIYDLPVFTYKGYRQFMVLPTDIAPQTWDEAQETVRNLVAFGYDDWFLPINDIYQFMYDNRDIIGGFSQSMYWTCELVGCDVFDCKAYIFDFAKGKAGECSANFDVMLPSRPIRYY